MTMRILAAVVLVMAAVMAGCAKKDEPAVKSSGAGGDGGGSGTSKAASASAKGHGVWLTDFEAAKALAAEEGKDLLVDFSGSDWCIWCKRLDGEVFSKPGFMEEAGKWFVFVLIDFPNDKSGQSKELQAQNQRLSRMYGIDGFPTVLLMRASGTPYAQTGYQEGGPDAYLEHLKELRQQR